MAFNAVATQWNWVVGMSGGGRTGLRYEAVYPFLDRLTKGDEETWNLLFEDIQIMEQAALVAQSSK